MSRDEQGDAKQILTSRIGSAVSSHLCIHVNIVVPLHVAPDNLSSNDVAIAPLRIGVEVKFDRGVKLNQSIMVVVRPTFTAIVVKSKNAPGFR